MRYCTDLCALESKIEKQGECWVWAGYTYTKGNRRLPALTFERVTYRPIAFAGKLAGIEPNATHVPDVNCGNSLCCNPDHIALRPRKTPLRKKDK